MVNEFQRVYKAKDENVEYEKELNAELAKLQKTRQKYMDMFGRHNLERFHFLQLIQTHLTQDHQASVNKYLHFP